MNYKYDKQERMYIQTSPLSRTAQIKKQWNDGSYSDCLNKIKYQLQKPPITMNILSFRCTVHYNYHGNRQDGKYDFYSFVIMVGSDLGQQCM